MGDVKVRFPIAGHMPSVEAAIQRWASRLDDACGSLRHCSVIVEHPLGGIWRSRFAVRVEVVLDRSSLQLRECSAAHDDVYLAVAEAFRAALRRVRDHELARFDPNS
jgi:hypothetical protein